MSFDILYLGDGSSGSTSRHRADALRRLGHRVILHGQADFCPPLGRIRGKLDYLTGHTFRQNAIIKCLRQTPPGPYDLAWIDSGWWCGEPVAKFLRTLAPKLVLLNVDDPSGNREPYHWRSLLAALPKFDLCAVVRPESVQDFLALGAPRVVQVWRGYDEVAHAPEAAEGIQDDFRSDVCFIGTRMEDRPQFMLRLLERGVPVSIWGNGWRDGPHWKQLKAAWRGPGLAGAQYVAAIQQAKVCLGLLSRLNRDQHTQRSAEIPYAGGLFCAQRTAEHLSMFAEDLEAVFWNDADECAQKCHELLADDSRRQAIRAAGAAKVRSLNIGNQAMVGKILAELNLTAGQDRCSSSSSLTG